MKYLPLILLLAGALILCGCARQEMESVSSPAVPVDPNAQLLCLAEDLEQAEEVAALYGISLVDFGEGVAVFYTEEDPAEVIARGLAAGWPELSLNGIGSFT